jgi:hypothetical protein
VADKVIAGFDSPAAYLPRRARTARRAALPGDARSRASCRGGGVVSSSRSSNVPARCRRRAPRRRRSSARFAGTAFDSKTDALLVRRDDRWHALSPCAASLTPRSRRASPPTAPRRALLDIGPIDALLASYRERALGRGARGWRSSWHCS